jgi:hypothetical protein
MNNDLIPFGKYKGQPLEALQNDKKYLDWITSQDWFRDKYANIYNVIINNFQEPTETPEHNKIQVLFTDTDFVITFIEHILLKERFARHRKTDFSYFGSRIYFEVHGIDVAIGSETWDIEFGGRIVKYKYDFMIEIKPNLSDDYPAVLRQMKGNSSNILLIRTYDGKGATLDQVKKIFAASAIEIILLHEIT